MSRSSDEPNLAKQVIAANEERFRALVTATSDVIYSLSADWEVMRELDGRGFLKDTQEPMVNWRAQNVYAADMNMVNTAIDEAIRQKKMFQLEHRVNRADGTAGWTFSRAVPILDDNGDIIEWFGVASDITERKQAEEALQAATERGEQQRRVYETITSNTPDLMYVFGLDYRFTYANKALLEMWGKTWDNAVGKSLLENGYEPWHAEMHEREIDRVVATKQPIRGEVSFPHATLGRRIYDYIFTPVINDRGEVEAIAGTTRDVTDRKRWELELAESADKMAAINEEQAASNQELSAINYQLAQLNDELLAAKQKIEEKEIALRLAIDAANFGTWFIHSVTREFVTDARLKELFGYYPEEDLSIEQALAQITEDYRAYVADKFENALNNNGDFDVVYSVIGLHDKRLRWLRAIGNLRADASGTFSAFTGVVMDITDQYLAAKKVERAEESLRIATESGELASWYYEMSTGKFETSARFNQVFGLPATPQPTYQEAFARIREDHRNIVTDAINTSVANGNGFNVEYPLITGDNTERWVRSVGKVVINDRGESYLTGVLADITEQKLDDLRKNDFIGMVSHELKTPLTSLNAIIQVANAKLKNSGDEFLAGAMAKANTQVKRMSTMINGFLNISRLEAGKVMIDKSYFNIEELVRDVADELRVTTTTHHIELDLCEPVEVFADLEKINSVISNLISNAIKYSPANTTVRLACVLNAKEVTVSVSDEGMGIDPEDAARIFDRYFRVESSNTRHISGFGIGLYLSAEIVERHQGRIWLESEPGKGSTFYFSLPL